MAALVDGFAVFGRIKGMNKNWHKLQQEALALRSEAWMATHLAALECYAARVDAYRARLEKAGYSKEHPADETLAKHATVRMDVPQPEKTPLELPELPKPDFTTPPRS